MVDAVKKQDTPKKKSPRQSKRRPCGHVLLREMSEMSSITFHATMLQSEVTQDEPTGKSKPDLEPCIEEDPPQLSVFLNKTHANTPPKPLEEAGTCKLEAWTKSSNTSIPGFFKHFEKSPLVTMDDVSAHQKRSQMWDQMLAMQTKASIVDLTAEDDEFAQDHAVDKVDPSDLSTPVSAKKKKKGKKKKKDKTKHKRHTENNEQTAFTGSNSLEPANAGRDRDSPGHDGVRETRPAAGERIIQRTGSEWIGAFLESLDFTEMNDEPDTLTVTLPLDTII